RRRVAVIFPPGHASRFARQVGKPHARESGELTLDGGVAAGLVDDVEVPVEPDRNLWVESGDQSGGDPALGFRERTRPGVVDPGKRVPLVGEVAVEVDAAAVPARIRGDPVGVEDGDDPKVELAGWRIVCEAFGDGDAGLLVSVDATDDERPARRVEVVRF